MLTISEKQFINTTGQALGVNQKNDDITNNLSSIHKMIKNISNVVETMTFNNGASLSVTGKYKNSYSNGHLILNPKGIDLRFLPGKIKSVDIKTTKGTDDNYRHNITFKNKERPVQKTTFFSDKMIQNNDVKNYPINQQPGKLMDIDTTKSTEELWRSLTDVHHFYPMLEQKGISKIDALRSVPEDLAFQVKKESVSELLNHISSKNEKFMIFVGNDSAIQIYTGKIDKIIQPGKYTNLNKIIIHGTTEENEKAVCKISPDSIAQVWVVNKFSEGKTVTSLEVFDKDDNHIIQFYGWRKRGEEQSNDWQGIINKLPKDNG
ncbi:ChuX/HutX family heme-like substrate-binding protein [Dryocola sp. BD626]|uniref:ChuX/HutX family heme-like substrate-binding protein n=1 Tax=Dryocola sp. BD626 TaxID=3133273 RepID=UPI003F4F7603